MLARYFPTKVFQKYEIFDPFKALHSTEAAIFCSFCKFKFLTDGYVPLKVDEVMLSKTVGQPPLTYYEMELSAWVFLKY